jgi:hypothetical protein
VVAVAQKQLEESILVWETLLKEHQPPLELEQ